MPRSRRTAFAVPRPTDVQWTGFLDMLRYDQATVDSHLHDLVVLVSPPDRSPTTARWASFGLHVLATAPVDASGFVPRTVVDEARAKLPTARIDRRD